MARLGCAVRRPRMAERRQRVARSAGAICGAALATYPWRPAETHRGAARSAGVRARRSGTGSPPAAPWSAWPRTTRTRGSGLRGVGEPYDGCGGARASRLRADVPRLQQRRAPAARRCRATPRAMRPRCAAHLAPGGSTPSSPGWRRSAGVRFVARRPAAARADDGASISCPTAPVDASRSRPRRRRRRASHAVSATAGRVARGATAAGSPGPPAARRARAGSKWRCAGRRGARAVARHESDLRAAPRSAEPAPRDAAATDVVVPLGRERRRGGWTVELAAGAAATRRRPSRPPGDASRSHWRLGDGAGQYRGAAARRRRPTWPASTALILRGHGRSPDAASGAAAQPGDGGHAGAARSTSTTTPRQIARALRRAPAARRTDGQPRAARRRHGAAAGRRHGACARRGRRRHA